MTWYRNYYQQQFGDRVRSVVKNGATPPASRGPSGSGGKGGGIAVFLVVVIILAVLRGASSSHHPPPRSDTPPRFDPILIQQPRPLDEAQRWHDLNRKFQNHPEWRQKALVPDDPPGD
jgi:hypothetical protein